MAMMVVMTRGGCGQVATKQLGRLAASSPPAIVRAHLEQLLPPLFRAFAHPHADVRKVVSAAAAAAACSPCPRSPVPCLLHASLVARRSLVACCQPEWAAISLGAAVYPAEQCARLPGCGANEWLHRLTVASPARAVVCAPAVCRLLLGRPVPRAWRGAHAAFRPRPLHVAAQACHHLHQSPAHLTALQPPASSAIHAASAMLLVLDVLHHSPRS